MSVVRGSWIVLVRFGVRTAVWKTVRSGADFVSILGASRLGL